MKTLWKQKILNKSIQAQESQGEMYEQSTTTHWLLIYYKKMIYVSMFCSHL